MPMDPELIKTFLALCDDPTKFAICDCGCIHSFFTDVIGRPEVRFYCGHEAHKLLGYRRTYGNCNGAVLQGDDIDPDYMPPQIDRPPITAP